MFAFGIWDRKLGMLFLARDRMGEKPLYYAEDKAGGLIFASEMKSIMIHPNIKFVLGGYSSEHLYGSGLFDATIMSYTDASEDIFVEYLDFLFDKGTEPEFKLITKYFNSAGLPRKHYFTAKNKVYSIEVDDFKFTKQHAVLPGEALPLDISRGCIFACRFCNYPHLGKSKTDYIRGMEYVKEELIYNYENFGTTNYMILDDTFNETLVKMDAFYKMVE
jgi:hypothetical protein